MLFMVIEHFRNRDPAPIYRRFRDQGRMMPEGLHYRGSWIETDFDRCFQLMECDDERLFADWKQCPVIRVTGSDDAVVEGLANQVEYYTAGRLTVASDALPAEI